MTITKIDPVWAENGLIDETITDAKISQGWVSGESPDKPTIETFNLLQNRTETKINELAESVSTLSETGTRGDIIKRVFPADKSLVNPMNTTSNKIAISTRQHNDCTLGIDTDNKKLFVVNISQLALDIIDLTDFSVDSTLTTTSAGDFNLPTTSGVYGVSCCSDENYLYILFKTTNNYYLHSYNFDMTVNPNWPANGITWARTSASTDSRVRIANDDYLMVSDAAVSITSGTAEGVRIYASLDGTYVGAGAGDTGLSSGSVTNIESDGTYVYIAISGSPGEVSTMTIASPGASGRGGIFPIEVYDLAGMCYAGDLLLVTCNGGSDTDPTLLIYECTEGFIEDVKYSSSVYPTMATLGTIVSDGLNFYSRGFCSVAGGGIADYRIVKVNINSFNGPLTSITDPINIGKFVTFTIDMTSGLDFLEVNDNAPMVHDGQDLWVVGNNSATTTDALQGYVYRIAKPLLR